MDVNQSSSYAKTLKSLLGLETNPVRGDTRRPATAGDELGARHWSSLLSGAHAGASRRGRHPRARGIACPAAARAFGFKGLPEGLRTGNGLVSFGIVSDPDVGKTMFERMPRLEEGSVTKIHLFPAALAERVPDVIVVEDEVERLMWIVLAVFTWPAAKGSGAIRPCSRRPAWMQRSSHSSRTDRT